MFNDVMEKHEKEKMVKLGPSSDLDEKDHRLACGWYVEMEGSGQHKRYLRSLKEQ